MRETPLPTPRRAGWRVPLARAGVAVLRFTLRFSPRPMALVIRRQFAAGVAARTAALDAQAPTDVVAVRDERYGAGRDEVLDVYVPAPAAAAGARLPTVVWTHGGAFVGGSKDELAGWFRTLAHAGVTVVAPRYSLAPEARYPTPVRQLMAALRHLQANADRLHVDPARLVLAGDSAGAQISAQVAALVTNPSYAELVGVAPAIAPEQLRGAALCCGIYDLSGLSEAPELQSFLTTCGWSYSGTRDFRHDERFITAVSVARHLTAAFPPTFLTAGNADPLLPQSRALATTLQARGVAVETLFYPDDHQPPLPHEYQFDLDLADGRAALRRLNRFFRRCTRDGAAPP